MFRTCAWGGGLSDHRAASEWVGVAHSVELPGDAHTGFWGSGVQEQPGGSVENLQIGQPAGGVSGVCWQPESVGPPEKNVPPVPSR